MPDRVAQFKKVQSSLNDVAYNDNFTHVISNIFDNMGHVTEGGESNVKREVIDEINNMWSEINTIQNKTNIKVEFNNLHDLQSVLSTLQVYASIGYIIYADADKINASNSLILLDKFRTSGCDLFTKKNTDYGDAFANYGIVGVMVRMGDKIARINSLSRNKNKVTDESIMDTFIDLYNYSIMALILVCDQHEADSDPYVYRNYLLRCATSIERELRSIKSEYKIVTEQIQRSCDHEWVRDYTEYCDSHTPHYCKKCDLMN
tara:strand:- start:230 stop:1012 length:783 start_codon:yes stop_codon:yes gene_type:complete